MEPLLDFRLIEVLDALLHERSVTAAGKRVGLSQPATSAALKRLRRHYHDPLLVRNGRRYDLTPLAVTLTELLAPVLEATARLSTSRFSLEAAYREFSIIMTDADADLLAVPLNRSLRRDAPNSSLRVENASVGIRRNMDERLRLVDGAVLPHRLLNGLPYMDLYEERWVCIADDSNEAVRQDMTPDELSRLSWVVAFESRPFLFSAADALRAAGISITVTARTESFRILIDLVRGSDQVALIPSRMVPSVGEGFRIVGSPSLPGRYGVAFAWHPVHERQPQHQELRRHLAMAAGSIAPLSDEKPARPE